MTETDKDIDLLISKYADGTLTPVEAIGLAEWVERSRQNAVRFRRTLRAIEDKGTTTSDAVSFWQRLSQERQPSQRTVGRFAAMTAAMKRAGGAMLSAAAVGAVVCVSVIAAYLFAEYGGASSHSASSKPVADERLAETVYKAPCGERLTVVLPDSTKVVLNSEAKLTLDGSFGTSDRRVKLDGEAYFDVAKNPAKPFAVECGDKEYIVRGTSFNIVSYATDRYSVVTLHTGCLEAHIREDVIMLNPGDELRVDDWLGQISKRTVNLSDSIEWIESNSLSFTEYPLKLVANRLAHKYNVKINIHCSIENILYDGRIDNESLEETLRLLTVTSPVPLAVTEFDGEYYISKRETVKKRK